MPDVKEMKEFILLAIGKGIFFEDDFCNDKELTLRTLVSLHVIKDYKKIIETSLKNKNLSKYFIVKAKEYPIRFRYYGLLILEFSKEGLQNIETIYSLCKLYGLID